MTQQDGWGTRHQVRKGSSRKNGCSLQGQCHGRGQAREMQQQEVRDKQRCPGGNGWKEQQWGEKLSIEWAKAVGTAWSGALREQSMKCWSIARRCVLLPSHPAFWPRGAYGAQGLWLQMGKDVLKRSTVILDELSIPHAGRWKHGFKGKFTGTEQLNHHGGVWISRVR